MRGRHTAVLLGVSLLLRSASCFYLPGVAPQDYVKVLAEMWAGGAADGFGSG